MTSTPLTAQQLDQIEARAQAATKGPWERYAKYGKDFYANVTGSYLQGIGTLNFGDGEQAEADERLVRHAQQDITALVDAVRRLTAELADYEVLNPQQCPAGKHADWLVDSEYAHACPWCENERLTARVAELEALATPHTPRLCICGHSHLAHTVPAPHSCFAYGQTCPCPEYRQMLPDEAIAQQERTRQAAGERNTVPA